MEKIRILVWDKQCSQCHYDIEMQGYVVINKGDTIEELWCIDCYNEYLKPR